MSTYTQEFNFIAGSNRKALLIYGRKIFCLYYCDRKSIMNHIEKFNSAFYDALHFYECPHFFKLFCDLKNFVNILESNLNKNLRKI
jgi:hypothetical protein